MTPRIQELLDSITLNSLVVNEFHACIAAGKLAAARNLLANENFDNEDITLLVEYFYNKNQKNVTFLEINSGDVRPSGDDDEDAIYLFRYGQQLVKAFVTERRGILTFYCDSQFIPIFQANQIWRIVPTN